MNQRRLTIVVFIILCLCSAASICAFFSKSNDIFDAVKKGRRKEVESSLKRDPGLVNALDENGNTPLHFAVYYGKKDIVELLITNNAEINKHNNGGAAPLHMAVMTRKKGVIKLLLRLGADIEVKNAYGRTPLLMVARDIGDKSLARLLLESGSDVNSADNYNETPIVLAAWRGNKELVDLFLENSANIHVSGENGKKLLIYSAEHNLEKLFSALKERQADLTIKNNNGGSLLHSAAAGGSLNVFESLISEGFIINEADRYGWTPLHYASKNNQKIAAEFLISRGIDLNSRTLSGKSAYNIAEENDNGNVLKLLKNKKADPSPQDFPVLRGNYLGQRIPGDKPELFAKNIVSTNDFMHGSLTFSPDGMELFWSSTYKVMDSGHSVGKIFTAKISDGKWTKPKAASFSVDRDDVPFFSPDGNRLYFLAQRNGPIRIWFVERLESGWSDPEVTDSIVNEIGIYWQMSISTKGTFYFNSSHGSGFGMGDIWSSERRNGKYSHPENIGRIINSEFVDMCPYIAQDESYIIFSSDRPGGFGRTDLYISFRNDQDGWTKPVNLGKVINSSSSEICPIVSADNKYLFFNSRRNGNSDVYWVKADFLKSIKNEISGIRESQN